jgi:hypothetical protein
VRSVEELGAPVGDVARVAGVVGDSDADVARFVDLHAVRDDPTGREILVDQPRVASGTGERGDARTVQTTQARGEGLHRLLGVGRRRSDVEDVVAVAAASHVHSEGAAGQNRV